MGRHRSRETSSDTESSATSDRSSSSSGSESDRSSTDSTSSDSSRYSREVRLPILILIGVPSFTNLLRRSRAMTQRMSASGGSLSGSGCFSASSCLRPSGLRFYFRARGDFPWSRLLRGIYQRRVSRSRSHCASDSGNPPDCSRKTQHPSFLLYPRRRRKAPDRPEPRRSSRPSLPSILSRPPSNLPWQCRLRLYRLPGPSSVRTGTPGRRPTCQLSASSGIRSTTRTAAQSYRWSILKEAIAGPTWAE